MKRDNNKILNILFPVLLLVVLLPSMSAGAAMEDYCVIPPFLGQSIPPNVLIVLDNSGSMCGQAYAGSYDPSQFTSGYYYGYYDSSRKYRYNGTRWEETTDAMNTGTVANPIASGNFLNWATMRRVEVAKKLLIGGKSNPRSWNGAVTVKLDGETGCDRNFSKDFDTSAGNLIYPFTGDYRFSRDNSDNLRISPISGGTNTFYTYPTGDISVPAGWTEYPVVGAMVAYTKVDESPSDEDSTYIQNNNTTSPVILDYNYTQAKPAGNITVTVHVRAKKTASGSTRNIQGVLRIGGVDYASNSSSISTSYDDYSFEWALNPATNAPWAWNDIKSGGIGSVQGFGVKAAAAYNNRYPRITQVYLDVSVTNPTGGPYNTIVDMGPGKNATGIIDTLSNNVRFGLSYYSGDDGGTVAEGSGDNDGGTIDTYVNFATPTNMINSIQNMVPSTWTPLGETLYELTRYFRQDNPYYSNSPADYQTGLNYDPYWYDYPAGFTDQYVPCAKSFVLFLTDGESTRDRDIPGTSTSPPYEACSLSNIKACSGFGGNPNNPNPRFAGTSVGATYVSEGTDYLIDVAYWARTNDMRPGNCTTVPTVWQKCIPGNQNVFLYSVFMFGTGSSLLKDAAIYGGFNDLNGNGQPDCNTAPAECYKDSDGDGTIESNGNDDPISYYEGDDGYRLETSIRNAIEDILKRVTSGTAASVLASSEGRGANIIQALFHPKKIFDNNSSVDWAGQMQNLWYYIDPRLQSNTIREDTVGDKVENLTEDMQVSFRFDLAQNKTVVDRYSDTAPVDGMPDTLDAYGIDVDAVNNLWEAGDKLFRRDLASDPRTVWTTIANPTILSPAFTSFTTANAAGLRPFLQAATEDEAKDIINYTLGIDFNRVCTGTTDPCPNGDSDCGGVAGSCVKYRSRTVMNGGYTGVWKLGDIVTSTPKLQSPVPFNNYYTVYRDATYSEFTASKNYRSYGTAYAGANDGMLHAFDFGIFQEAWFGQNRRLEPARLFTTDVNKLGRERWAFIPKNILPYLKYLANTGYCHIFSVDASPIIFDAAIHAPTGCAGPYWDCPKQTVYSSNDKALDLPKTSWRTVLVGSLRLGGACKGTATPCPDVSGDGLKDCVNTPVDVAGQSIGYSSYFALDITDQENPKLLWEFSDNDIPLAERLTGGLGYSTAGPAFMRISARNVVGAASEPDTTKNGRWFVVLASGPTGPIDTAKRQFEARSDQPLKLFVLDLLTGQLAAPAIKPGIDNAFAGSLLGGKVDYDLDYQDDVLYFGYTKKCNATDNLCTVNTWSDGGVLRLTTNEDLSGNITNTTALNPGNWKVSTLMSDTGPVTSAVANLVVRGSTGAAKQGWLYYGTGRYFFRDDDLKNQRILFGVQEPCVKLMGGFHPEICLDTNPDASLEFCAAPVSGAGPDTCGDLYNVTTGVELDPAIYGSDEFKGWYINLESPTNDNAVAGGITAGALGNRTATAERVMTDPVAVPNGAVFFTTFAPTDDICSFGGNTFLWRVKYDTGSFIPMSGSALLQLSTGEIKELDMKTAFADKIANIDSNINNVGEGGLEGMTAGRRTGAMIGVPPVGQGLSLVISPTPIDRMIHIKKR